MKKFFLGLASMLAPCAAFAEPATIQSTALAGATTLASNAVALLIVVIAIPLAFAGYRLVKKGINRAG